jgi:hypothetical protein
MDTDILIERLCQNSRPVQPLCCPYARAKRWFAVAAPWVALAVLVVTPRGDLDAMMLDWRYVVTQLAALATAITAAVAAFSATIPGYDRRLLLLPLLPLAVWIGSLGQGCVTDWLAHGPAGLALRPDWPSVRAILAVAAVPALAMVAMLRRGAPLAPVITAMLGGLAAAALGDFGLRLFHTEDASPMVLVWQVGTVVALAAAAGWAGNLLLNWRATIGSRTVS